jgi:hypothetical protein
MTTTDRPACNLDLLPHGKTARYRELRRALGRSVRDMQELADGWALELDPSAEAFLGAAEWITLERLCCPFLQFELDWSPTQPRVQLRLRGSAGAKQVVGAALGRGPGAGRQGGSGARLA